MKHILFVSLLFIFFVTSHNISAQEEQEKLDLPGDNLNLYATLKLFQESETLEGFEKALNEESSQINNLDLDGDDNIDYIKVTDNVEDGVHYISLKVAVNENEDQDVAVFVVEKDRDGKVQIQLIGDEELYGKDYIIEPGSETGNNSTGATPNPGYTPNNQQNVVIQNNTNYQISAWPVVQYIFVPNYVIWHSPWRWNYYPSYWHPWRPRYWHYYYGYHYNLHNYYNVHYHRTRQYINPGFRQRYYSGGLRSRSVTVVNRNERGDYRRTYSKPGLAKDGYNTSRKKNPQMSSGNNRLPSFDKTGRPVINRPVTSRPVTTKPVTSRPGRENNSSVRPVTRPGNARPGNENTSPARPVTRPGNGNILPSRPVTRPAVTRPANTNRPSPSVSRPGNAASRPNTNAAQPANTRPASRERTPR